MSWVYELSLLNSIVNQDEHTSRAKQLKGVVVGIVTQNNDPEKLGRIKIKFPWVSDNNETDWTRVAVPMAGIERGVYFIPEIEDEVLVAFEHGDINRPLVIGALWNIEDKPPKDGPDPQNNIKKYVSRCGHELIFDETESAEKIQIVTKGKHKILLDDTSGSGKIEMTSTAGHRVLLDDSAGSEKILIKDKTGSNYIEIDSIKNSISIQSALEISIKSTKIKIEADAEMTIKAGGILTIQGALVKIN